MRILSEKVVGVLYYVGYTKANVGTFKKNE